MKDENEEKGVVQGDDEALSLITGCRVYYVWYSLILHPCGGVIHASFSL